jgi:hypothetical protein
MPGAYAPAVTINGPLLPVIRDGGEEFYVASRQITQQRKPKSATALS